SAPNWLGSINDTLFTPLREAVIGKLIEKAIDKGIERGHKLLRTDERDQIHHLELALKNAAERSLASFHTEEEQAQFRDILTVLCKPGSQGEVLRSEALTLFTLSDTPDLNRLTEIYKLLQPSSASVKQMKLNEVDISKYLSTFFES